MKKIAFIFSIALLGSCNQDDQGIIPFDVTTATGKKISLTGIWKSSCVEDNGNVLEEDFTFNMDQLQIRINSYESIVNGSCTNLIGNENVLIEFTIGSTFNATLNSKTVLANKISGSQTLASTGQMQSFKQAFYVDDSGSTPVLYHARFQEDGGPTTSDGFPTEIIPIGIFKQ